MKKSILCIAMLAACIIGACSKEHVDSDPNNGSGGNNGNNPSSEIKLELSETHLFASSDAITKTVVLTANADWNIDQNFTENEWAWCSVTPTYGSAGTTTLTVDIQANGYDKRIHDFSIRSGDTDISMTVEQKQVVSFLIGGSREFIFYDEGGQVELTGGSSVGCEIAYLDGTADWISEEKDTRAFESLNFRFRVAPYDGMESRRGRIVLKAPGEDLADTVQVIQYHDKVIDIPDPYFRQYCIQNFDKNNDGQLTKREAFEVTSITTWNEKFESLQGVEAFENLDKLHVIKAQITEIDLSHLSELSSLDLSDNKLRSLDLRKNNKLKFVKCSCNELETLLIGENNLASLSCSDNRLSSLTIEQGGDNSFTLNCDNNRLTSLSLTGCRWLNCDNNRLTSLDLSNSPMCNTLYCRLNQLQALDLSMLSKLTHVFCSNNRLETLVLPNKSRLEGVSAEYNNLVAVDLSTSMHLVNLFVYGNRLRTLSCNDITTLESLSCYDNELETLDITGCVRLKYINCSDNKLTDLDVSMTNMISWPDPLYCSMQTLKTLYLKEGWQGKIKGINVDRNTHYIQETTQILYK